MRSLFQQDFSTSIKGLILAADNEAELAGVAHANRARRRGTRWKIETKGRLSIACGVSQMFGGPILG